MTWKTLHRRSEVLRAVTRVADERRDGALPTDVPGVPEAFRDDLDLLGALSLQWFTRLSGRIELALLDESLEPDDAVVLAWARNVEAMPGVRAVLDRAEEQPADAETARVMRKAADKQHAMLALLSGRVDPDGPSSVRVGEALVRRANRAGLPPFQEIVDLAPRGERARPGAHSRHRLLHRLRTALAA